MSAAAIRASAAAGSPAPVRTMTGSGPVTSMTVDGVPGSSPPSRAAATPARICAGTSASRRGSGPPGRFALVATTAPSRSMISAVGPDENGHTHADRLGSTHGEPAEARGRVGHHERERSWEQCARDSCRAAEKLGYAIEEHVDTRCHECRRLDLITPLEPVQPLRGLRAGHGRREAVDGVGRDDDELARLEGCYGTLDDVEASHRTRTLPSIPLKLVESAAPRVGGRKRSRPSSSRAPASSGGRSLRPRESRSPAERAVGRRRGARLAFLSHEAPRRARPASSSSGGATHQRACTGAAPPTATAPTSPGIARSTTRKSPMARNHDGLEPQRSDSRLDPGRFDEQAHTCRLEHGLLPDPRSEEGSAARRWTQQLQFLELAGGKRMPNECLVDSCGARLGVDPDRPVLRDSDQDARPCVGEREVELDTRDNRRRSRDSRHPAEGLVRAHDRGARRPRLRPSSRDGRSPLLPRCDVSDRFPPEMNIVL